MPATTEPVAPVPAAPVQAPSAASASAATMDAGAYVAPDETLMGRMAKEARGRTGAKPTADDVLSGLEPLGASIPEKQQSLASTYDAIYCLGGYTADRALALDVCEYKDAAAAVAGRTHAKEILAKVTTRDVWAHKTDTLAIVQLNLDAATTARKKKLVDAFLAM